MAMISRQEPKFRPFHLHSSLDAATSSELFSLVSACGLATDRLTIVVDVGASLGEIIPLVKVSMPLLSYGDHV
jgi:cell division protein FtsW (lipid II flippase)